MTPKTASLLNNVAEDVFDFEIDPTRLEKYLLAAGQFMFVAVAKSLVVGQLRGAIILHPDKRPDLYIENLGVSPAWKRQGIATRLLETTLAFGREQECEFAYVTTELDNEEGVAFYKAFGLRNESIALFDTRL